MNFIKINNIYRELKWVNPLDDISKIKIDYQKKLTKEEEETPFFWIFIKELFNSEKKEKLIKKNVLNFLIEEIQKKCSKENYNFFINTLIEKSIELEQIKILKLIKEKRNELLKEEHLYKCVHFGSEKSFNFLLKNFKQTKIFDNSSFKDLLNNPSSSNPLVISIINNNFELFKKIYTLKNEPGSFDILTYLLPKTEEDEKLRHSIFYFLSKQNKIWIKPKYSPFKNNIFFSTKEEMCSYIAKEYKNIYPKSVMAIYYSYEDIKQKQDNKFLKKEFLLNKKNKFKKQVSYERF